MNRVAFIMVNHNGGEEVLRSALSVTDDLSDNDRLILVDNGSTDNSWLKVKEEIDNIICLRHRKNLSFAAANNRGIRWALKEGFKYIGIINPDVRVSHGMTDTLLGRLEGQEDSRVVSPIIYYENPAEVIWFGGGKIWWLFAWVSHRGQGKPAGYKSRYEGSTDYLTGCCWLAPSGVWRRTGPMDTKYGMYAEDVDWSWRARQKGVKLIVEPSAELVHRLSQSSGGRRNPFKIKYRTMATRLFFLRHTPDLLKIPQAFLSLIPIKLYSLLLAWSGEWASLKEFMKANFMHIDGKIPWPPE
ncbi:MAG: glycosyltransferase family 2 protein [Candidatus Electryonea clarkiae]|nr:glycosyltransferase family 2 protein [Candidatus Electryonea clarkiae]MDP8285545.1 glycosyltransferase family 2 protein [Candidatus Electryonea clarkiae]